MRLSVVVTIVDAGAALDRCLAALANQQPPLLEVLVPWDDTVPGIPDFSRRFPAFRFLPLARLPTLADPFSAAGQHELFDRRRAAGLAAATGDVVAILEDRGVPSSTWARTMVALHETLPYAVIGGAIDNGRQGLLQRAVYYCDFHRYQRPFPAGPRPYVSDVNIGYKRRALDRTAHLWKVRYHETTVHWALQRAGEALYLTPELVVEQHRDGLRLTALLRERLAWGRLFAYTRARESGLGRRILRVAVAPLLPGVLLLRHVRLDVSRRVPLHRFLQAAPLVVLLEASWSLGEVIGELTVRP